MRPDKGPPRCRCQSKSDPWTFSSRLSHPVVNHHREVQTMSDSGNTPSLDRRTFVTAATGYALAVTPVTAWAISTPAAGLATADVTIPVKGGNMPAYVAHPQGKGPFPVVMVIQEIFGLHEYIKDVCRRLASAGYYAIAPSLYFRHGDATKIADFKQILKDIVSKVSQAEVFGDLDHLMTWLKGQPQARVERTAITGFCWGGNVVWTYCAQRPQLKAGVAWYGRLTGEPKADVKHPIDLAASLKVPVLGLYGDKDSGIPVGDVEKMRLALAKGASGSKIIVYPGAEHAFHADYRPSYQEQAAKAGWSELLGWFATHGMKG